MTKLITKAVALLFLLNVAAAATNLSLRASPLHNHADTTNKKEGIHHHRGLELVKRQSPPHKNLNNENPNKLPKPRTRQLQSSTTIGDDFALVPDPTIDPELCRNATALETGEVVEGSMHGEEGVWYSIEGTGKYLLASTCTDDSTLDASLLDTVINVYSGPCESLIFEAYDDQSGNCGNGKSAAYFQTAEGDTYYVNVTPYSFSPAIAGLAFGLTVTEIDVPPNTFCDTAIPVEIDELVVVEPTNFGSSWYSVRGNGGYLAVSTCSSDDSSTYSDVYSGGCDDQTYITSAYSDAGTCGIAYFEATASETYYLSVNGYSYDGTTGFTFELKVYEVDELPNTICLGATPLELGAVVKGEITTSYDSAWYSIFGTGDDLLISTCTGNRTFDATPFDSVIDVFAKDCDDLRYVASDDEGGKCGNGKSAVILPSVDGLIYHINVLEYLGMTGTFGLKVSAASP